MTPKEKAIELVKKYLPILGGCEHDWYCGKEECKWDGEIVCTVNKGMAKKCALIAVEEKTNIKRCFLDYDKTFHDFYNQVKEEILKL